MPTKLFLTGATGYIGGDALYQVHESFPHFEYAVLVRSEDKAKKVQEKFPKARIVLGSLDDSEIIEREAAWADIVIHTADSSDHVASATAISKGLVSGHSPSRPGFWLHMSGTGILTYFDRVAKKYGESSDKVFNDGEGVEELVNLPDDAWHRDVDKIVLKTGTDHADSVKTAILCPPSIYGPGRGPGSGRGQQVYNLVTVILKDGYIPRPGKGLARWNNVHIYDLSNFFQLLVDAALDSSRNNDAELWGKYAYFLIENGEHVWGELASTAGKEVVKADYAKDGEPRVKVWDASSPEAAKYTTWGHNSRAKTIRAKKVLGWKPKQRSLLEELPDIVKSEAARLGL